MSKIAKQTEEWMGNFGDRYTKRNALTVDEANKSYKKRFGISKIELNSLFLGKLDRAIKILEVGSNIGNQLLLLQRMGFKNLYGIEINSYAIEFFRKRAKDISVVQGSAFDIPFKDKFFDLVFTSGLLIHIAPTDINIVMEEIHRCARKYIWGFEYYAEEYSEIVYRGKKNLLWKADFPRLYCNFFEDIELIKEKRLKYSHNNNLDIMFLLGKKSD